MNTTELMTAVIVSIGLILAVAAQSQEKTRVKMKDVPLAAQTTIRQEVGNEQIIRIEKKTRNGKECYEAIVDRNGQEVGVRVDPDGTFLGAHPEEIEQPTQSKS